MFRGNRTDEFHDDNGLTRTCTTKDARLTTFGERSDKIDHFYTGLEDLYTGGLLSEWRRGAMDRVTGRSFDRSFFIHRLAEHVENAP